MTASATKQRRARRHRALAVTACCAGSLALAESSLAQQSRRSDTITYEQTEPDKRFLIGGISLFGLTYGPSLVVAGTSGYPADKSLYAPIVGPWANLANRGPCGPGQDHSCDAERTYKVLLVANGVGQALGALQIISGFVFPVHKTVETTTSVIVAPQFGLGMVGLTAKGNFY